VLFARSFNDTAFQARSVRSLLQQNGMRLSLLRADDEIRETDVLASLATATGGRVEQLARERDAAGLVPRLARFVEQAQ
jgi:hypothetical protein